MTVTATSDAEYQAALSGVQNHPAVTNLVQNAGTRTLTFDYDVTTTLT